MKILVALFITAIGAERRQEYIAEIKTNTGSHFGGVIQ